MAVALTGTGGLWTRLGKIGYAILSDNTFLGGGDLAAGGLKSVGVVTDGIEAQYASANQQLVDGLYTQRDSLRTVTNNWKNYLKTLAQTTVIKMVDDDSQLPSKDLYTALKELIRQMVATADDIDAPTCSATVAAVAGNNGDGVFAASVVDKDGKQLDNVFDEVIDIVCTTDSQGGGTEGTETFSVKGEVAVTDQLSHLWPAGSGASTSLAVVDAATTSTTRNLITNGDWEDFTVANTPDSWTIGVGAAGTDIFDAGAGYEGSKALKLTGTGGSPLSELYQAVTLQPNTVYAFNFWIKDSGAGLVAGVVQVSLHDGTNVINDDASTANSATRAFSDTTGSYVAYNGFFRTPRVLPTITRFRIKATTALTSGESVYIDHLSLVKAAQIYTGGPWVAGFSGATKFIKPDAFTLTIANNYASDFATMTERLFNMRALDLKFPTDTGGTETIADSLLA